MMHIKLSLALTALLYYLRVDLSAGQGIPFEKLYWYAYTGRHFDDLVTGGGGGGTGTGGGGGSAGTGDGSDAVLRPTLLVMYDDRCEKDVEILIRKAKRDLPYEQYIVVAKHHYGSYTDDIQYKLDERDNLFDRYAQDSRCLHTLFWEAGTKLDKYIVIPEDIDIGSFIWHRFFLPVTVQNECAKDIIVKTRYDGESEVYVNVIPIGGSSIMYPYLSNLITFNDMWGNLLYGIIHRPESYNSTEDNTMLTLTITDELLEQFKTDYSKLTPPSKNYVDMNMWANTMLTDERRDQAKVKEWRGELTRMNMITFQYPVQLPRISTSGYKVFTLDSEFMQSLVDYCKTVVNENTTQLSIQTMEPITNSDSAKANAYNISNELQEELERHVKPVTEEFIGTDLKMLKNVLTAYYLGSFVRGHIDIRSDHVITAMVVIGEFGKEPIEENTTPWSADLIDYNGDRQTIDIKPGEMLVYEAKTIIIGRRAALDIAPDSPYAVAHISLSPSRGWPMAYVDKESEKYKAYAANHKVEEQDFRSRKTRGAGADRDEL